MAPVPAPWKACTQNGDDVFYFNFETSESIWDHPLDDKFKKMVLEFREKGPNAERPKSAAKSGPKPGGVERTMLDPVEERSESSEDVGIPAAKDSCEDSCSTPSGSGASPRKRSIDSDAAEARVGLPPDTRVESGSGPSSRSSPPGGTRTETRSCSGWKGVGLAPSRQGDPDGKDEFEAQDGGRKSSPTGLELSGQSCRSGRSIVTSALSELSQDFASESEERSWKPSVEGDTLDLSATLEESGGVDTALSGMSSPGRRPPLSLTARWERIEAKAQVLARCLPKLREVREKQVEYLRLLQLDE